MNTQSTSQDYLSSDESLLDELDLLIDNELTHEQELRLFEQLDNSPDGWRICAQAFWEEKVIRNQLNSHSKVIHPSNWKKNLSLAACAVLALTLTFFLGKGTRSSPHNVQPVVATNTPSPVDSIPVGNPIGYEGLSDQGELIYTTQYALPEPLLDLMVQTGNRVEHHERNVQLTSNDDESITLPMVETRMFIKTIQ